MLTTLVAVVTLDYIIIAINSMCRDYVISRGGVDLRLLAAPTADNNGNACKDNNANYDMVNSNDSIGLSKSCGYDEIVRTVRAL